MLCAVKTRALQTSSAAKQGAPSATTSAVGSRHLGPDLLKTHAGRLGKQEVEKRKYNSGDHPINPKDDCGAARLAELRLQVIAHNGERQAYHEIGRPIAELGDGHPDCTGVLFDDLRGDDEGQGSQGEGK